MERTCAKEGCTRIVKRAQFCAGHSFTGKNICRRPDCGRSCVKEWCFLHNPANLAKKIQYTYMARDLEKEARRAAQNSVNAQ